MPRHPFLHSSYTIAPTPFAPDGSIDRASITTMVEFLIGLGVQGITMLGVMAKSTNSATPSATSSSTTS